MNAGRVAKFDRFMSLGSRVEDNLSTTQQKEQHKLDIFAKLAASSFIGLLHDSDVKMLGSFIGLLHDSDVRC